MKYVVVIIDETSKSLSNMEIMLLKLCHLYQRNMKLLISKDVSKNIVHMVSKLLGVGGSSLKYFDPNNLISIEENSIIIMCKKDFQNIFKGLERYMNLDGSSIILLDREDSNYLISGMYSEALYSHWFV